VKTDGNLVAVYKLRRNTKLSRLNAQYSISDLRARWKPCFVARYGLMPPKLMTRNRKYINNSTTPSRQLILSLDRKYHKNMLAMTENMTKLEKIVISTRNVHMVSVAPRMRVVSTKHVPTMFPKDMSACPFESHGRLPSKQTRLRQRPQRCLL